QYFERQRFEYHPEKAGTPYVVLLGLLGKSDAQRRGLTNTAPFQPLPAGTTGDANCDFVPETGHRLCWGFRNYWRGHGLEFGDPGVSYREALALFGYPISEEFRMVKEDGREYTVQYFERARFEWHPQNAAPYDILLGLLGKQELQNRGWLP
ncbi:MAG: peptidoglycan hydrolase, partial [Chloroflexota bacterium]|nr:peptidoglycan hydrolase [Chloroflexota bacterium]